MNDIVKICKTHGEFTLEQTRASKAKGKIYLRCKLCEAITGKKYYEKNRERSLARQSLYKKTVGKENHNKYNNAYYHKNKDVILEKNKKYMASYMEKNRAQYRTRHQKYYAENKERYLIANRLRQQRDVDNLTAAYVAKIAARELGIKRIEIPSEIIDIKRVIIKIKRIKKSQNASS